MRIDALGIMFISMLIADAPNVLAAGTADIERPITANVAYLHMQGSEKVFSVRVEDATQLKVVLAHDKVDGPRETVGSMCRRYNCLAAVNGDFYGGDRPHGGIVSSGHIYRTSFRESGQAWLGTNVRFVQEPISQLVQLELRNKKTLNLPLNIVTKIPTSSMFTSSYGGVIPVSNVGGTFVYECICKNRPDLEGESYFLRRIQSVIKGPILLKRNQIAVSVFDKNTAVFLSQQGQAIHMHMPDMENGESIGAHPVILTNGRIVPSLTNFFATSLHPRTVLARNALGRVWLVAIDTRVSLIRAAQIVRGLGATEAINMDGGGSTTFVVRGKTLNNPADKAEREVASAILVVKTNTKSIFRPHTIAPKRTTPIPRTRIRHVTHILSEDHKFTLNETTQSLSRYYPLSSEQGGSPIFGLGAILILISLGIRRFFNNQLHD